jgi:hypothetical protein
VVPELRDEAELGLLWLLGLLKEERELGLEAEE